MREKFSKCGTITRVWLSIDRETGECKGFGFVTFSSRREAVKCVKEWNQHPQNWMDGKHVEITHAKAWDSGKKPVRECSFGLACCRADCYFTHPAGWDPDAPSTADGTGAASEAKDDDEELEDDDDDDVVKGGGSFKAEETSRKRKEGSSSGGGGGGSRSHALAAPQGKKPRNNGDGEDGRDPGEDDGEGRKAPWRKKKHKHVLGAKARKRAKKRAAQQATTAE